MPPAPKPTASRARDHKRRHADRQTITGTDGNLVGPTLEELTGRADWPTPVVQWFNAWRRSPQARLFVSDVEWETLSRAAVLVEQFHDSSTSAGVRVQTWNSLRQFEASLGALHADRVKSHLNIRPSEAEDDPESGAKVVDYRSRIAT